MLALIRQDFKHSVITCCAVNSFQTKELEAVAWHKVGKIQVKLEVSSNEIIDAEMKLVNTIRFTPVRLLAGAFTPLENLKLANERFFDVEEVDMVIGADLLPQIMEQKDQHMVRNNRNFRIFWSKLGYLVSGYFTTNDAISRCQPGTGISFNEYFAQKSRRHVNAKHTAIISVMHQDPRFRYKTEAEMNAMKKSKGYLDTIRTPRQKHDVAIPGQKKVSKKKNQRNP